MRDQLGLKQIPPKLAARLSLLEERAAARAKYGSDTALKRFTSDLRILRAHGWMDAAESRKALQYARSVSKEELSKGLRYMTEHYFDRDGMASESVRWLNERAALAAEIDWIARSGQNSMKEARAWLSKNEFGIDDLRSARSYAHAHYKPPKGGWPAADTLKLPR